MSAPSCRVTLPAFVAAYGERLRAYHRAQSSWGALHVCLADANWTLLGDLDARRAEAEGDLEGADLVRAVMQLSPSQRRRLERHLWEGER
jgi:hypothetical protein